MSYCHSGAVVVLVPLDAAEVGADAAASLGSGRGGVGGGTEAPAGGPG